MTIYETKVKDFHTAMECDISSPLSVDLLELRYKLLKEELDELKTEIDNIQYELKNNGTSSTATRSRFLKELTDLQYVLSGMAISFGLPLEDAFIRVHNSNMSKLVDGKPIKREDGKVLKGPNYYPPILDDLADTFK